MCVWPWGAFQRRREASGDVETADAAFYAFLDRAIAALGEPGPDVPRAYVRDLVVDIRRASELIDMAANKNDVLLRLVALLESVVRGGQSQHDPRWTEIEKVLAALKLKE